VFFPQQKPDFDYLSRLGFGDIVIAATTNEGYTEFLEREAVDVIGSRLHGGIRAMQKGRRSLILAVDNRAAEIARDTNLPVRDRADTSGIERWIQAAEKTEIRLPTQAISDWKAQFRPENLDKIEGRPRGRPPERDYRKLPIGGHTLRKWRDGLVGRNRSVDD